MSSSFIRFDRLDGIAFQSLDERHAKVIVGAAIPGGRGYVYPAGVEVPAYALKAVIADECAEYARRRTQQLAELIENPNFKWHYIRFHQPERHHDGFYVASPMGLPRALGNLNAYEFDLDIQKVGNLSSHRWVTVWDAEDEDYTGWAALECHSLVTLPCGATDVAWLPGSSRITDNGIVQYLINPTRQEIMYTSSPSVWTWYRAEVKVFDTVIVGDTDRTHWLRVFSETHLFSGDQVFENGLLRYIASAGSGIGTFYIYDTTALAWVELGQLKIGLTGFAPTSIKRVQVTKISSEETCWEEIRQYAEEPIRLWFSLRRGAYHCRVKLSTFSLGIDTGTYVQLSSGANYWTQIFNSAASGAAGGGDLPQDATNNYECGYDPARDIISGFALCDQPTQQPYDCGVPGKSFAESNIWTSGQSRVFFVIGWLQETNPFVIATARANALAIARQCLSHVEQTLGLVDTAYYV